MKNFRFDFQNKIFFVDDIKITRDIKQEDIRKIGFERWDDYQDNYSYILKNKIRFEGNDYDVAICFKGSLFRLIKIFPSNYQSLNEDEGRRTLSELYEDLKLNGINRSDEIQTQLTRFNTLLIEYK